MTGTGMSPRKVPVLSISDVLHLEKGFPVPCSIKFPACDFSKRGWTKAKRFWNHQCLQSYVTNPNLRPFLGSVSLYTSNTTMLVLYFLALEAVLSAYVCLVSRLLENVYRSSNYSNFEKVWVSLDPSCQTTIGSYTWVVKTRVTSMKSLLVHTVIQK